MCLLRPVNPAGDVAGTGAVPAHVLPAFVIFYGYVGFISAHIDNYATRSGCSWVLDSSPSWRVTEDGTVTGGEGVSDSKSCARVGIWHCASISWTGTHHPTSHEATLSRQLSESLSERKLAMRGRSSTRSGSSIIAELLHLMVLTAAKWRVEPVVGTFGNWAWTDILLTNGHCDWQQLRIYKRMHMAGKFT